MVDYTVLEPETIEACAIPDHNRDTVSDAVGFGDHASIVSGCVSGWPK